MSSVGFLSRDITQEALSIGAWLTQLPLPQQDALSPVVPFDVHPVRHGEPAFGRAAQLLHALTPVFFTNPDLANHRPHPRHFSHSLHAYTLSPTLNLVLSVFNKNFFLYT